MSAKTGKVTTIEKAALALVRDRDRLLVMRPEAWRGNGAAVTLHLGRFYRVAPLEEPEDAPPFEFDSLALVSRWEVLPLALLREEATTGKPATGRRVRRASSPRKVAAGPRRLKRGRPSADELRAELPEAERGEWFGVAEAAKYSGASRDRIRRAMATGTLAFRTVRGVALVERRGLGKYISAALRKEFGDGSPVEASVNAGADLAGPAPAPATVEEQLAGAPAPADVFGDLEAFA